MRSPRPSSSSYSLAASSLQSRLLTIFKKAEELTTLCDIEACVIHYGPDGELRTWPENREKVRDLALRYIQLDKAKRLKKSVHLYGFLNKKTKTTMTNNFKKKAKKSAGELKYPISNHYSPDQINQLIESLELSYSNLQERRRFLAAKANKEDRSLNPSQFTKYPQDSCVYDQNNNNNFQHLFVSDHSTVQESGLRYQLMPYGGGYDQNMMCTGNNFQHPCVSLNTHDYSMLPPVLQELVSNYGLNQLMQQDLYYGFDDQNMCMGDAANSCNVPDPFPSDIVSDGFSFDFKDPYGGNPSFSKIFQTCLQAMFMRTDYFRDLLYHLSSSTIPNDNSEISLMK